VDIDAVDTHRPKPSVETKKPKSSKLAIQIDSPSIASSPSTSVTSSPTGSKVPVGASGEIVRDFMSPIVPISPGFPPKDSKRT
jgi:6-phosphofructo-2-kinase/fructose-2,6-biphosphatase 2